TQGPGAGTFGTPQQPTSAFSDAQPSGSLTPPPPALFNGVPPSPDVIPQAPHSGFLGPTLANPAVFGQAQPPAPFGNAPFSNGPPLSGPFSSVPPQGGFIPPPPPDAAPYARAQYAALPYQAAYPYPAARPANLRQGMAITSLVLGCLSPFSCAVFGVGS